MDNTIIVEENGCIRSPLLLESGFPHSVQYGLYGTVHDYISESELSYLFSLFPVVCGLYKF